MPFGRLSSSSWGFRRAILCAAAIALVVVAPWRQDGSARAFGPAQVHATSTATIQQVIDQYQSGDFNAAVHKAADGATDLRVLLSQLNFAAPTWFPESGANEQRRLAVATFALEVVMARRDALWKDSGKLLLEWACSLLRRNATPLPAERLWHLAAIGVIEGAPDGLALEAHLAHAERRFPKEPRFVLGRAVALELQTWPQAHERVSGFVDRLYELEGLGLLFANAVRVPDVRPEAFVRWGFYEFRLGHVDRALEYLDRVGPTDDGYVDYLRHLFRGRALDRAGTTDEAIAAYQRAIAIAPKAQTARVALASLLSRANRPQDAAAAIYDVLGGRKGVFDDPWFSYGSADQRFWPALATELRRQVRR